MLNPTIASFELHPDRTISVQLSDGSSGLVALAWLLDIGGIYDRLRDDAFYQKARLAHGGRSIRWPSGQVELGADGIAAELVKSKVSGRR